MSREDEMKEFEVITRPKEGGKLTFLTQGRKGKSAIRNLIHRSADFNMFDYDEMTITVKLLK